MTVTCYGAAEADLLAAYDQSYASANGGTANTQVIIANAVSGSNLINDRSGTGARMRIAGYHQSAQANYQLTSNGGYVNWMSSYDSRLADVVDAGNARGADLVAYICESNADGAAAVAQQPGRYSSFDAGSFWSTVVAHEAGGHNYGCDHRGGRENPKTVMLHNYCGGGAQGYFSNPNIWLNNTKLLGEGSCLGAAVSGGDNAYLISTSAQGRADAYARVVTAPNLSSVVRRWSFNQPAAAAPGGTTIVDPVSGTALATVQGNGATFTGSGLRLPGGASGSGAAYLQLPAGVLSSQTNVTLEIWATPLSVQNWARLVDFNNGTTDYLMLTLSRGIVLNDQRFECRRNSTSVTSDSSIRTEPGLLNHYAITFADNGAGGGRWTWYRNGDQVAYLDVNSTLASLPDVNNWLGRSAYGGDSFANCEYSEVRISSVAMTRDQIFANYRLGPNAQSANVVLNGDDPFGQSSFAAAGQWSDGLAPSAGKSYETYGFRLRTPADNVSRTFAGQSLKLSGGGVIYKGTASSTTTFNNLSVNGSTEMIHGGSGTWTLAGNVMLESEESMLRAANGPVTLSANLSGNGNLLHVDNTVTLTGSNGAFTGKSIIGDGRFGRLSINSEARLGANPATFTADHLTLNRGVLYTTANTTLDDVNRGVRIGVSGGIFNVAPGTTLTLATPVSSPAAGEVLQTTPIYPNPSVGLFIKDNTGTLVLTHPNNSHTGEIAINGGGFTLAGAGRLNNGDHVMPVTNNGVFTFDSTSNQTLSGAISGNGAWIKSNTGMLTLKGGNSFTGAVAVNGGTLYANASNAANNRALSGTSGITVNSGATLRTSANALFGWDGTQEKPIVVNAGGNLSADGGSDVGVGSVTLAGGTLASSAPSTTWGSWRFDEAGDVLGVTSDSTVSATNVKFGNSAASINVATGATLQFTGTVTDATSGGISYLTKNGSGTLVMAGANTFTGATAVNAGMVKVNGSLAAGSAVTVASGATLSGSGTIGGAITVQSGGTLAPGADVGALTAGGSVILSAGGTTAIELNKATMTNDRINVGGTLTCDGSLVVVNIAGVLAAGDSFTIFQAPSVAGQFSSVSLPSLSSGLAWDTSGLYSGVITVVSTIPLASVPGFESPSTSTFLYNPTGGSWTFSGSSGNGSGVTANNSAFTAGNAVAPEGTQVAFLQGASTITQTIGGFVPGTAYTVTFAASQRQNKAGGQPGQTFDVRVDGTNIGSFVPPQAQAAYWDYTASFVASASSHVIAFVGTNLNGGDNTVFVDQVRIDAIATLPAPPSGLTANATSHTQINLSWTAQNGAASYNVKRSAGSGGPFASIATGVTGASYNDTGLAASTTYYYVVSSVGGAGEGTNSGPVSAITQPQPPPAVPSSLVATTVSSSALNLDWEPAAGADGYNVKRATTDGGPYSTVTTGVVSSDFQDTDLASGTTYYYIVSATGSGGESAPSTQATATTLAGAPSGLAATVVSASAINLTWSASSGANAYEVKRGTSAGGPFATVASGVTGASFGDTGLNAATTYYYVVAATNAGGSSPDSAAVNATTLPLPPAAPTGLAATPGSSQIALAWATVSGATGYNVKRSIVSGGSYTVVASNLPSPSYTDMGLTNGTIYYYVVNAMNAGGTGADSSEVAAAPNGLPGPWITVDIGTTGLAGSATFSSDAFTVKGAGTFGGTTDGFRYVYQPLSADGSIIARVSTLGNTGTSARVGVMIRDTLANNARMAALSVTGSGSYKWERRTTTGGSVSNTNSSSGTAPNIWVRLVRAGNTITASKSTNGTSWTTIGSATVTMASSCYVGLAVSSGSTTTLNTSVFDNITAVP